mmetsp:Transcript_70070/g.194764  ORF Transcript_70070/g.194764 Transcript_70070/m.194764 type:complete len:258 (+) Transcript_70070:951-1724(+)
MKKTIRSIRKAHNNILKLPRIEKSIMRSSLKNLNTRTARTALAVRRIFSDLKMSNPLCELPANSTRTSNTVTNTTTPSKMFQVRSSPVNSVILYATMRRTYSTKKKIANMISITVDHVGNSGCPLFKAKLVKYSSWKAMKMQLRMTAMALMSSYPSLCTTLVKLASSTFLFSRERSVRASLVLIICLFASPFFLIFWRHWPALDDSIFDAFDTAVTTAWSRVYVELVRAFGGSRPGDTGGAQPSVGGILRVECAPTD